MNDDFIQQIKSDPNYNRLVSKRSSFSWFLTALVMLVFYGFIYLTAFNKPFMATHFAGSVITYALPIGLFVIFFTIIVTGIYVRRANNQYDALSQKVRQGALK